MFARREFLQNGDAFRLIEINDTLKDLFEESRQLVIRNHVTGGPTPPIIGQLECFETQDNDLGLNETAGVYQRNLSVQLRFVRAYAQPF